MAVFFGILVVVAVFGIINTMSTSVFERTKELGTLRAIGLRKGHTMKMVLYESIILSMIGVIVGWIIGFFVSLYLSKTGVSFGAMVEDFDITVPMAETLYAVIGWWEYLITFVIGIAAGLIGGLSSVFRIGKLRVVDALRA